MIATTLTKVSYVGNGKTTAFPFTFPFNDVDDVKVAIYDIENDTQTILTKDYYIDSTAGIAYYPGYAPGEEAAESEQPAILTSDYRITIYRETPHTQLVDLGDKYPLPIIEGMDDKAMYIIQEISESVDRCLKVPVGSDKTAESVETEMIELEASAKASAKAAATSETNAATSATEAATSATASALSATEAADSVKAASEYADKASNSALSAAAYNAPAYDSTKTYNAGDVIYYTDGNSYRCIADNTTGIVPTNTDYWSKVVTYVGDDFFELDTNGDLMPCESPTYSAYWVLDSDGNIVPTGAAG